MTPLKSAHRAETATVRGRLVVLGGGGHGKVVADAAAACGLWQSIVFADDRYPALQVVEVWAVAGRLDDAVQWLASETQFVVALGDNLIRLDWTRRLSLAGCAMATVVHPRAVVSPFASVGAGSVVLAGSVVNPGARIGEAAIVNTGATVDHDCEIGDAVHLSPGVHLGGNVRIGPRTWLGVGSSVRNGVTIGADVMVGVGAAVVKNTADSETVMGVPARARGAHW